MTEPKLNEALPRFRADLTQVTEKLPVSHLVTSHFPGDTPEADVKSMVVLPTPPPRKRELSHSASDIASSNKRARKENINKIIRMPGPSSAAYVTEFPKQNKDLLFLNQRPLAVRGPPITLFHPVFDEFLHSLCDRTARSRIYLDSSRILLDGGREAESMVTDNNARLDGLTSEVVSGATIPLIFWVWKNEIGTGATDASIQAALGYGKCWAQLELKPFRDICLCPSLLVAIEGPWMTVFGGLMNEKVQVIIEPLTDFISCVDRPNDGGQRLELLARLFCALRDATAELRTYYKTIQEIDTLSPLGSPHRNTYRDGNEEKQIRYQQDGRVFDNKLVWRATLQDGTKVIVKFTRRYNIDAHTRLAAEGLAPHLYYADEPTLVTSAWRMIVMENITESVSIESLSPPDQTSAWKKVQTAVHILHSAGLVFGDLRSPNILVQRKAEGELRVVLVDHDWCGLAGESRFPPDLNPDIEWPGGAQPGEMVFPRHDLEALKTYSGLHNL